MATWVVRGSRTIDEIVEIRRLFAVARSDPSVQEASLSFESSNANYVFTVVTREPSQTPDDHELTAFLETNAVESPRFTHAPLIGFTRLLGIPNLNGDVLPVPQQEDTPITVETMQQILREYREGAEGRSRLATAMAMPLRRSIDYQSVARRTFLVDQLPDGALPYYPAPLIPSGDPVDTSWIKPGVWAITEAGLTVNVVDCYGSIVEYRVWRDDSDPSLMELDDFARIAKTCEEPKLPPTWYERLDTTDDLYR